MNKVKLIVVIILSIAAGIFAYQNIAPVSILFLRWSTELPQTLLLFGALLIGYLLGMIQMFLSSRKKKKKHKAKQQTEDNEQVSPQTGHIIDAEVAEAETTTYTADSSNEERGARS